jgi:biotin carboxylase
MKKIAIVGASYLQLPLVKRAKEMGFETHCFAWEEGAVCKDVSNYFYPISILDKDLIYEKCSQIQIDGITTIATDMAIPTICYTAEKLGLISNSYKSAVSSTNKGLMRNAFVKADVKSPKFIEVASFNQNDFLSFQFPLIVKPVDRSGSRGVSKVNDYAQLRDGINSACKESFSKQCIVEEFIEGVEVSVESISWDGEHHILAITDKVTTNAPYFVELAHHQPSMLNQEILTALARETSKALTALDVEYGAGHSEFKITGDGKIYNIEVGARMGGDFIGSHLVQLSTGYDFLQGVINVALNQFEKPQVISTKSYAGVYFLSKETESLLEYFTKENPFDVERLIQNQSLKNITNSNDRSGYLIYNADRRIDLL